MFNAHISSYREKSMYAKSFWIVGILLILVGLNFSYTPTQAQDNSTPITAPETYTIDLINISKEVTSRFVITFEFEGTDEDNAPVYLTMNTQVIIQPEPDYYQANLSAEGNLQLFDLVSRNLSYKQVESELVYLNGQLVTAISLPETAANSCGKQTTSGTAAIYRLESQTPFPSETFLINAIPPLERLLPDGDFGNTKVARYANPNIKSDAIKEGQIEVHILPEFQRLTYFSFEGRGEFLINESRYQGKLQYTYTLLPDDSAHEFNRPDGCEVPQVYGVELFEPSVNWITRENTGSYLTGQNFERLIAFHQEKLTIAGFEALSEPLVTPTTAELLYAAQDETWVRIAMFYTTDGTQVEIQVLTEAQ
jgi:hypothetical protein